MAIMIVCIIQTFSNWKVLIYCNALDIIAIPYYIGLDFRIFKAFCENFGDLFFNDCVIQENTSVA